MKNQYLKLLSFLPFLFFYSCGDADQHTEIEHLTFDLNIDNLERHIETLASDEFRGRMPMTVGEDLTLAYLENELSQMGIQPGNRGSFFQEVGLVTVKSDSDDQMVISGGDSEIRINKGSDFVIYSQLLQEEIVVEDAELVFCGFGVVAPEYNWNDYEGIDMEGKIAVVLVNDPGFYMGEDNDLFTGNAMTYYGRWTYKYEEAARQGAAGVIIVHNDDPAGYGWNVVETSWSGAKMQLDLPAGSVKRSPLQGWITYPVAEKLMSAAGFNKDEMLQSALSPDFKPVPLGLRTSATMKNTFERGTSQNVIAMIEGSEKPEEYIIYTTHWDHLGVRAPIDGDSIYNGAVDNATGVAILIEIARIVQAMEDKPKRSLVFLWVTAEEQGLLGSSYYANNPIFPTRKTVANLNVDGIFPFGPTNDLIVVGYNQNQLVDWAKDIADTQGRYVVPDQEPEKGFFYRSDQFSFAKVGVPAIYAGGGTDLIEGGKELGEQLRTDYLRKYYHQPGDKYIPEKWDLRAIAQDGEFFLRFGMDIANSDKWPEWNEISEFRAIRKADLGR